jgi:tetratricopeptide (TPR) repeat protein
MLLSFISIDAKESFCKKTGYLDFQNDKNQSESTLVEIIKKNPKDIECTIKLIDIYLKKGKIDKGFELLARANRIDPNYIKKRKIYRILGIALYMTNLKKKAINNNTTDSWNALGAAYYKMGVFHESIKAYNKSLKINPNQISPRLTLALDFSRTNQAYRALEELSKVISLDKDNFYAYYYAGKILKYQIKDIKKANTYLQKAKILCKKQKESFGKNIYKQYIKDLENETKK